MGFPTLVGGPYKTFFYGEDILHTCIKYCCQGIILYGSHRYKDKTLNFMYSFSVFWLRLQTFQPDSILGLAVVMVKVVLVVLVVELMLMLVMLVMLVVLLLMVGVLVVGDDAWCWLCWCWCGRACIGNGGGAGAAEAGCAGGNMVVLLLMMVGVGVMLLDAGCAGTGSW